MGDDGSHPDPRASRIDARRRSTRPTVLISDRQRVPFDKGSLVELAERCLLAEGRPGVELSVSFVDEEEMAMLRGHYLGEEGPTDVLAFEQDPAGEVVGDVVICPAYAARAAEGRRRLLAAELRLLLVHGVLHLLGYDHDDEARRAAMWRRQEAYSGVRAS
jgi:probable rRNA maturation factor